MLELESADAIAFSAADAEAIVATSPGRHESYSIERRSLATLLTSPEFSPYEVSIGERLASAHPAPLFLRPDAERQRRAS